MKAFEYRAANAAGEAVLGVAWAKDELELDAELEGRGLVLTTAKELEHARPTRAARLREADLVLLTSQLATVTGAGVPLLAGLEGIRRGHPSARARALLGEMIHALEAGQPLSKVMERYPRAFPPVYRASVVAGEAAGALDRVLARLSGYLEWVRATRATTAQALIYPAILVLAVAALVGILVFFLVPRLVGLFPNGVTDLPAETRLVLAVSDGARAHAPLLALLAAALVAAAVQLVRSERGRVHFDRAILAVPVLGSVARSLSTGRFASTAATLQDAGCDVFRVLETAASACGNRAMEAAFRRATERVRRGVALSEALAGEALCDPLLVQLVAVGERSGQLDQCLARVAAHFDAEVPRRVRRMLALFEPAVLLGAGAVVAFVLLAALLPMFEVIEAMR